MFIVTRRLISLCPKTFGILFSPVICDGIPKSLTSIKNARFKLVYKQGIPKEITPGSRYAPPSPLENAEEFITSNLKNRHSLDDEEWEDFKSELMDKQQFISEENFSSIVMGTLLTLNQLDLSHNFLKYLEKGCVQPNFLTYLKYISLCSKNLRTIDEEHILKMLDKVLKQIDLRPVLDVKSAEYVIQGLCATNRWKESFDYLDKLVERKPSRESCNAFACAAIRNGDENLAWEILMKWVDKYDIVSDRVIEEFLMVALKMQKTSSMKSDNFVVKLFQYMQERDVIMSMGVAKLVEQYFLCHRNKWKVTYSKVSRKGVCENCNYPLKLFELENKEFDDLCDSFLRRVVMKSDIYINTNKKEFDNYIKFINSYKPFHIVLDGLNTAHSCAHRHTKSHLSFELLNVVKMLSGKSRKLLVLGRKHMRYWPDIHKIYGRAKLFFTDNISQDDPFVIYAALASGPHTLFLSDDLMRDHLSRLEEPRLVYLFKRWQLSHQMFVRSDDNHNITFIEPVRHSITIQGNMEDGWHIPFDDKIILDPYEELNNWLCIEKVI